MALKNFIKEGTYARIERIDYSKTRNSIAANIAVYEDDTLTSKLAETPVSLNANSTSCPVIDRIITTEEALFEEAPEYLDLNEGENVLIEIPEDSIKADYASEMNGKLINKTEGKLKIQNPLYIKKSGSFLVKKEGKYTSLTEIVLAEQFAETINSENIIGSFYSYIKTLPAFSMCVDA